MKKDIKHLHQIKCPNVCPTHPGNYRSFWTADGLVICRRCKQVGHFAHACSANLPPPRTPTRYQNYRHKYMPPATSQPTRPSHTPNLPPTPHFHRPSYRSNDSRYDTMGYPYPPDAIYTNPLQRPPINAHHIYSTYAPPMHTPTPYHPHSRITAPLSQPYHVINTAPVTILARTNTIMTIPCTLRCSRNYLFELLKQHFVDHPVQYTPVIINAKNGNLPIHFINHSDHEVVMPKHSYVGAMEKVQELDQDIVHTNTSPEPISQNALSECLAHSDLLPSQSQSLCTVLQEKSGVFRSSIADLTSTPLVKHSIDTGNAEPIKQRA